MFRFEFVTPLPFELNGAVCDRILSAVEGVLATEGSKTQNGILNVAFVDDSTMQGYNREYRGIDTTTDVLSFHYFEDFSECSDEDVAGEILLSESRIRQQCAEYGNTPEVETYKLLIHSVFHVLGHDHETEEDFTKMKPLEDAVASVLEGEFGIVVR
jgi:probable rRNA maturation factor